MHTFAQKIPPPPIKKGPLETDEELLLLLSVGYVRHCILMSRLERRHHILVLLFQMQVLSFVTALAHIIKELLFFLPSWRLGFCSVVDPECCHRLKELCVLSTTEMIARMV